MLNLASLDHYRGQRAAGDFYGDRTSDILWRKDDGQVAIWHMDGVNIVGSAVVRTATLDGTIF